MAKSNPNDGASVAPESRAGTEGESPTMASDSSPRSGRSSSTGSAASGSEDSGGGTHASDISGTRSSPSGSAARSTIGARKKQYVIAPRQSDGLQTLGLQALQFSALEQALRNSADIEVVDKVGPKSVLGALADGMGGAQGVLVARMTEQKASILHQQGQGRLLVEPDQHLNLLDTQPRQPAMVTGVLPAGAGPVFNVALRVTGADGAPVAEAEVTLFGSMLPATGVSDANGEVSLSLYGETAQSVRGLYVKPRADYWSFYQRDPDIQSEQVNEVALKTIADWPALSGFPRQRCYCWGQKAMRLDQLPGNYRGQGIKIAIIDSGAATTHDNLHGIKAGFDVLNKKTNPDGWEQDTLGHGTHCAGIIAAADIASGIRGFAPDAEVHACKLFPGGQISQLIDALEYCIDKQIDVVNLSLGGTEVSEALEQQIIRAKRAGIACIVAAGNSGGPVQYPASSPNVLAVAAVGKLDEFPADSYHAQTLSQNVDAYGYFTASFSCFGPQVSVCAPGVAILSCVPPNNFAVWDGTSMATPHVTGLAALTLAHHPDFQTAPYLGRGAERVERLFQLIRASARRVSQADQSHTGYGMPDVLLAVGLQTPALAQAVAPQQAGVITPLVSNAGGLMGNPAAALAYLSSNPVLGSGMNTGLYDPLAREAARAALAAYHGSWFHPPGTPPYNPIMW
ncbi:S8 family serine peptidase [Pseudoduganella sp. FT93W]|uniref:S8 family serine peptidase n=1 Tax=Duganella fentianensis TaxID=2692177 RepID=A0A845I2J7_9BURK|nr:S8 family serine peptidase [Duganella fentianensis]MYN45316.1 S8 family serine peptidase [Duganella fentianensis]